MKRNKIENDLEQKTFNQIIADYMEEFLKIEGNYEELGGERFLKEEIPFYPQDTPQRNKKQVPYQIWKQLIRQHFFSTTIN